MYCISTSSSSFVSSLCNSLADFFFETLLILSTNLLPIKASVASAVFWIDLFEAVFIESVVDFSALSRSFWPYLLLKFLPMFFAKDKNPYPFTYILSLSSIISFNYFYVFHVITIAKFIISSISNGWLFWSMNHSLIWWYLISHKRYYLLEKFLISYQILLIIIINNITMN